MKKNEILTAIISVIVTLIVVQIFSRPQSKVVENNLPERSTELVNQEVEKAEEKTELVVENESKESAIEYLEAITLKGSDGYDFWCESSQDFVTRLYSPRSYQILDEREVDSSAAYTIRVESSNAGGQAIVNNWILLMKKEYGNWCVNILSKK